MPPARGPREEPAPRSAGPAIALAWRSPAIGPDVGGRSAAVGERTGDNLEWGRLDPAATRRGGAGAQSTAGVPGRRRARAIEGEIVMKFVVGVLTGVTIGAVGAVVYSAKSGRDLREAYEEVRSDLMSRDFEALGSRLEARFSEMQAQLEHRLGEVRDRATSAAEQAGKAAGGAVEDAQQGGENLGESATAAAEDAGQAVEAAIEEAKES
jgi:gas vesicle protein